MFIRSSVHVGAIPEALLPVPDLNEEFGPCRTLNVSDRGFVFGLFQARAITLHRISDESVWKGDEGEETNESEGQAQVHLRDLNSGGTNVHYHKHKHTVGILAIIQYDRKHHI